MEWSTTPGDFLNKLNLELCVDFVILITLEWPPKKFLPCGELEGYQKELLAQGAAPEKQNQGSLKCN
jgi:hypothetical protein